jgi:hypothetical protein
MHEEADCLNSDLIEGQRTPSVQEQALWQLPPSVGTVCVWRHSGPMRKPDNATGVTQIFVNSSRQHDIASKECIAGAFLIDCINITPFMLQRSVVRTSLPLHWTAKVHLDSPAIGIVGQARYAPSHNVVAAVVRSRGFNLPQIKKPNGRQHSCHGILNNGKAVIKRVPGVGTPIYPLGARRLIYERVMLMLPITSRVFSRTLAPRRHSHNAVANAYRQNCLPCFLAPRTPKPCQTLYVCTRTIETH